MPVVYFATKDWFSKIFWRVTQTLTKRPKFSASKKTIEGIPKHATITLIRHGHYVDFVNFERTLGITLALFLLTLNIS